MFSTHPATESRIAALEDMARDMGQAPVLNPAYAAPSVATPPNTSPRGSALNPNGIHKPRRSSALDPHKR